MQYKNITIIGTSHIARQSLEEVEKTIKEQKPDIIALELDANRYYGLLHKKRKISISDIFRFGMKGFLFSVIGAWVEKKLGEKVGVAPGEEMLMATKLAKKQKAKIALIDQDISITLKRFSQTFSWRERWRLFCDVFNAIILRKSGLEELGIEKFDLAKIPEKETIKKMIGFVKKRYPNIYMVLIEERNMVMAHNIYSISAKNPSKRIVAIVGAGHEDDILKLIKNKEEENTISYNFIVKA